MLLISTAVTFLTLYISVASTSPAPPTPNIPTLVSRKAQAESLCKMNSNWVRRECTTGQDLTSWRDVCKGQSNVNSNCPSKSLCQDIIDKNLGQTIQCVTPEPGGKTAPRHKSSDPQIGTSDILGVAPFYTQDAPVNFEVTIADDMTASVTAVFLSNDQTYAVKPVNPIVGTIPGKGTVVCRGSFSDEDAKARVCYPMGRYAFHKGDIIHFKWVIDALQRQEGLLAYTIWPS